MTRPTTNTDQLTQEVREALVQHGLIDPVWWLGYYLEDWFSTPMPWVHRGILAILLRRTDLLLAWDDEEVWDAKRKACEADPAMASRLRPELWELYGPRGLSKVLRHFTYLEDPTNENSPRLPIFELCREDGTPRFTSLEDIPREVVPEPGDFIRAYLTNRVLLLLPRGTSKTTLINGSLLYKAVHGTRKFPAFASETGPHALRQLRNITGQLTDNQKLKLVYGNLKPPQASNLRWAESEGEVQTVTGVCLAARGRGGQIRGLNIAGQRPDEMIFDDLESQESVRTPEQRAKVSDWFFGDFEPAVSQIDKTVTIVGANTLRAADSLGVDLMRDPEWLTVRFGAIDPDGDALWPIYKTKAEVEALKAKFARHRRLHIFYLEYFNELRSPEDAVFRPSDIQIVLRTIPDTIARAIAVDPAISDNPDADYFAIACVGITPKGQRHVFDVWGDRGVPADEQVSRFFDFVKRWQPHPECVGVEAIAYQRALADTIQAEMFKYGVYLKIQKISHGTQGKVERISGLLQPLYSTGYITHQRKFDLLETQLLDFPAGKRDFPDVVAMAVKLLSPFAPLVEWPEQEANRKLGKLPKGWRRF